MEETTNLLLYQRLAEAEQKGRFIDYKLDGWSVWPILRFRTWQELRNLPRANLEEFHISLLPRIITLALGDILSFSNLPRAEFVVLGSTRNVRSFGNSTKRDLYFDDLILRLGNVFKIDQFSYIGLVGCRKKSLIPGDVTSSLPWLLRQFASKTRLPRNVDIMANQYSRVLKLHLNIPNMTSRLVAHYLYKFIWEKRAYSWLFKRVQPSYLLLVDAYGNHGIVAAARETGVKVIELQHGAFDRYSPGYAWSVADKPYKEIMPLPNRVFVYGDYWRDELLALGFWQPEEVISVGSPQIDRYRNLSNNKRNLDNVCRIILTTQGIDIPQLVEFTLQLLNVADFSGLTVHIDIKLHPMESSKDNYVNLLGSRPNVRIILANEDPSTYDLLSQADLHLSIYSTCHYESLGLGVPTIILPFSGHNFVGHLHNSGYAYLVRDPKDVITYIKDNQRRDVPYEVSQRFFKRGALRNMLAILK